MSPQERDVYEFGPFRLDPVERVLWQNDQLVSLTPKAFETLMVLVRHSGHIVEKDELMKEVWPDSFVEEGGLARNISVLRKTLGEGREDHRYIQTIARRGYRFVAPVQKVPFSGADLLLEKHTFARIITEEEEEPGTVVKAGAALSAAGSNNLLAAGRWSTRKRGALVLVAVALLVGLSLALFHFWPNGKSKAHTTYPLRLTSNLAADTFPVWSSDGNKIAFASNRDGKGEIYVMDSEGSNVSRLTYNSAEDFAPAWSPDGSKIAFQSNRDGNDEIYLMNADGSNQTD